MKGLGAGDLKGCGRGGNEKTTLHIKKFWLEMVMMM